MAGRYRALSESSLAHAFQILLAASSCVRQYVYAIERASVRMRALAKGATGFCNPKIGSIEI